MSASRYCACPLVWKRGHVQCNGRRHSGTQPKASTSRERKAPSKLCYRAGCPNCKLRYCVVSMHSVVDCITALNRIL
jgi:hypothetical protein